MQLQQGLRLPENLSWAWSKVRAGYRATDGWSGELEVAAFEVNLADNLEQIATDFANGTYRMSPLRPMAQPKRKDHNGNAQSRQLFWVPVRDQVAWIAYLNIIGPKLDNKMPPWSYGNRLFRSVWFEESGSRQRLRIGPYRHTSGQIYRPFRQGWPVYRRHIHLVLKRMVGQEDRELLRSEPAEARIFEIESEDLSEEQRLPYLLNDYWQSRSQSPCWAGLDFEKFYPTINLQTLKSAIRREFPHDELLVGTLLDDLLTFPVDYSGLENDDLSTIGLNSSVSFFENLPTGLMASGFLANVALLAVDREVERLSRERQIAHFRYVDDHVVLAQSFNAVEAWIREYKEIVDRHCPGVKFNDAKSEPDALGKYLAELDDTPVRQRLRIAAEKECTLDGEFPTPLMTQTLAKISDVGHTDFELLDTQEQQTLLNDLEHLMLAEFPRAELRPETRVAFAAAKLSRLASMAQHSVRELVEARRSLKRCSPDVDNSEKRELSAVYFRRLRHFWRQERKSKRRTFQLLMKAVGDFPEKVRLWQHVLRFCETTGQTDFRPVLKELDVLAQGNEFSSRFVKAGLFEILARQAVSCSRTIRSRDTLPHSRRSAIAYLRAIFRLADSEQLRTGSIWYLDAARSMFNAAAGLVTIHLVERTYQIEDEQPWIRKIVHAAKNSNVWNWNDSISCRVSETQYSLATWLWWAEPLLQPPVPTQPGIPWRVGSNLLSPSKSESWSIWKLYPSLLPPVAKKALRKNSNSRGSSQREFLRVQAVRKPRAGTKNLVEWSEWVSKHSETKPFDPRVGEWTCLEIARQVGTQCTDRLPNQITPSDFFIPAHWLDSDTEFTWETWKMLTDREKLSTFSNLQPKSDVGAEHVVVTTLAELDRVYRVAVLLLGLLQRDFSWVRSVVPQSGPRIVREIVSQAQCSSWTRAILEGCLLPRQRETALWPVLSM